MFVWIWAMFFWLCLLLDGTTIWSVREQMRQNLELALDAGVVAGLSEEDLSVGRCFVDSEEAGREARRTMQENLAAGLKDKIELRIHTEQDGSLTRMEAAACVRLPLLMTRFAGTEAFFITVRKGSVYQNLFK
jgi:hypothetical protein